MAANASHLTRLGDDNASFAGGDARQEQERGRGYRAGFGLAAGFEGYTRDHLECGTTDWRYRLRQ